MKLHLVKFYFSIKQLSSQRARFQHKICFREDLTHLRLKSTPTKSITCRLYRDGNFLRIYKQLQKTFLNNLLPNVYQLPQNNEFKNLYDQNQAFCDMDRVLFWKLTTVNSLFNLKKLKNRRILFYLRPERRIILILLWLKNIIKLRKSNNSNCSGRLFTPLINFIITNKTSTDIFGLKLKIYKMRLLRG
jgi:hypothetical protein